MSYDDLIQVVLLFGALGYGAYYMTKDAQTAVLSRVKMAIYK